MNENRSLICAASMNRVMQHEMSSPDLNIFKSGAHLWVESFDLASLKSSKNAASIVGGRHLLREEPVLSARCG